MSGQVWVSMDSRSSGTDSVEVDYCDPVDQIIVRIGSAVVYLPPRAALDLMAKLGESVCRSGVKVA